MYKIKAFENESLFKITKEINKFYEDNLDIEVTNVNQTISTHGYYCISITYKKSSLITPRKMIIFYMRVPCDK